MAHGDEPPAKKASNEADCITYVRRLAALLAWLDHEHQITAELVAGEPAFYSDPANLDAYADLLDSGEWRTVGRPDGRAFFAQFAREIHKALTAPATEDHCARVDEVKRIWNA
jgi:hypothetical protein